MSQNCANCQPALEEGQCKSLRGATREKVPPPTTKPSSQVLARVLATPCPAEFRAGPLLSSPGFFQDFPHRRAQLPSWHLRRLYCFCIFCHFSLLLDAGFACCVLVFLAVRVAFGAAFAVSCLLLLSLLLAVFAAFVALLLLLMRVRSGRRPLKNQKKLHPEKTFCIPKNHFGLLDLKKRLLHTKKSTPDNEVQHTGAQPATRIGSRDAVGMASTILARKPIDLRTSCTNASDPNGVPGFSLPVGSTPLARVRREAGATVRCNCAFGLGCRSTTVPNLLWKLRSALSSASHACPNAATIDGERKYTFDGAVLVKARADNERKHAELVHGDRSRLVVVGVGTGGRWRMKQLLDHLASARTRERGPSGNAFQCGNVAGRACSHLHAGERSSRVRSLVVSLLPFVRRRVMPRRNWSTVEVPDGWLQLIRGPCPKSERSRRMTPQTHLKPPIVRQLGGTKDQEFLQNLQRTHHNVSIQTQPKLLHMRQRGNSRNLLEIMSNVDGLAVGAPMVPALDVQMDGM